MPTVVADKMCNGKVMIEPQTYSIGSFENKPTNDIFPSDLYGTVLIAVFCSSDKTEDDMQKEDTHFDIKLPLQDTANALISLGMASLFLGSSTFDIVGATTVFVHCCYIVTFRKNRFTK